MEREKVEKFQYRYDIDMQLFGEFNDTFCTINDHMGEIYGYSDLKDWEEIEYKRHIELLEQEVDKRIDMMNELEKWCDENIHEDAQYGYNLIDYDDLKSKIKELKGDKLWKN